jgi:hypothetical protein
VGGVLTLRDVPTLRQRLLIAAALSAAALRLLPLGWLQPLNFDEIEFFRATDWIRRGFVPYRDFWEHHTPLQWYLFAPVSALARGEGVGAVIAMRWLQVPLWIVTFWLAMVWMRRLELSRGARWAALAVALSSSILMGPAVEYRVDVLGCTLYLAGILCAARMTEGRGWGFAAGVALTLATMANIRLGPLVAATVLLFAATDPMERRWRLNDRAASMFMGIATALTAVFACLAAAGALDDFLQQVVFENYLGDRLAGRVHLPFVQRITTMFGVLIRDSGLVFEPAAIDPGGIVLLVFGSIGVALTLRNWRRPDARFTIAVLQIVSVVFILRMQRVYNYHLEIVVLMMLPFVALVFERIQRKEVAFAVIAAAWCVGVTASVFRGKEADLAWQDLIMREVHARTLPGEKVWDGAGWALRRDPAYRFWFLAELPQLLVQHRYAEPYRIADVIRDPPAAIVPDYYVRTWLADDGPLRQFIVSHYLPIWRDVWIPAPNGILTAERPRMNWIALRNGDYRLFADARLAQHPWFQEPVVTGTTDRPDAARFPVLVRRPSAHPELSWWVDGRPVPLTNGVIRLRKHQRLSAQYHGRGRIGLMLVPGQDVALFRQPPPGTTLEASYYRNAHLLDFRVRFAPD